MTVKRRSHGRNKKGRGHVNRVRCVSTGKAIPKDKAIKRFIVRNIVEASALRDIKDASCIEGYQLPKIYIKQFYSVEAAIHQRVVRVRSVEARISEMYHASRKLCDRQDLEPPSVLREWTTVRPKKQLHSTGEIHDALLLQAAPRAAGSDPG